MPINNATEYHLSRWNTYHDIVKTYNQELSVRFGTIFTIITSAWVLGNATGNVTNSSDENSIKALLTIGVTLAPVLLTLLLLHEMRIFIQYQQDNYFMIYHAYCLCSEDNLPEFEHILKVTQGSGASIATFLFMLLSNAVVLAVPIINLIVIPSSGLKRSLIDLARIINIVCLVAYIVGVIGSVVQYFILCRQIDPQVWLFAVKNNIKLTGAKVKRTSILSAKENQRYLLARLGVGGKGTGTAAQTTFRLFSMEKLSTTMRRLSRIQRKALFACIFDSWYRTKDKPTHILPYTAFIDVTTRCNLNCAGCFAHDLKENQGQGQDIDLNKLQEIITVLKDGGVKAIVFTGGEPTLWAPLYDVIACHRDILFLVFTNGQKKLFEQGKLIKKLGNLIFIFSIDCSKTAHELRRGEGTFQPIIDNINYFNHEGIGFATSTTVTSSNCSDIKNFLTEVEKYKPAVKFLFRFNADDSIEKLGEDSYKRLCSQIDNSAGLVVNLPQDELRSKCAGCVAGQYIFHIRQNFTLGNCPFNRETTDTTIEDLSAQGIADLLKKQTGRCHCPPRLDK